MKQSIQAQIKRAPVQPGVYIFKNKRGAYLYVGKAIRLRDRLRSYVNPLSDSRPSIAMMVSQIETLEWLVTDSEKEALILENNLIKTYRPKYNIMYRDDKTYLSLKLSHHKYPRLHKTRRIVHDGSTYFGPFSSVRSVNQTLKLLQKIFQVRDCTDHFFKQRVRPCLRYQIKLCTAPCVDYVTEDAYLEQVLQTKRFMKGQYQDILQSLQDKMQKASQNMEFEAAAHIRDQIQAIEETLTPQRAESRDAFSHHIDVIGVTGDVQATLIKVMKIRAGKLVDADEYFVEESISFLPAIIRSFLQHEYLEDFVSKDMPKEILIASDFDDRDSFAELLSDKAGYKVNIHLPQRGKKKKYLDLAERNAKTIFLEKKRKSGQTQKTLQALANKLHLDAPPERIEGYDISNFQGAHSYGSQVVFTDGEKDTSQYRLYKIKSVEGPDDFASMKEVLVRRLTKLNEKNRPDLILIDGGKGQLSQAVEAMQELNIDIPLVSIAKEKMLKSRSGVKYAPERLFLPGQKNAIVLPTSSPVLQLLQRVRDEAHRFGLKAHRNKRSKQTFKTMLADIPGVGPKRQKILLKHFKSIKSIQSANTQDLQAIEGMNEKTAQAVVKFFQDQS